MEPINRAVLPVPLIALSREEYDDEKRRRRKAREPFEYIRRVHQLQREK